MHYHTPALRTPASLEVSIFGDRDSKEDTSSPKKPSRVWLPPLKDSSLTLLPLFTKNSLARKGKSVLTSGSYNLTSGVFPKPSPMRFATSM